VVRIENGKPLYGEDIRDTTLPQETRQMQAVSFNKGCYLGQEIVERIRALGHVNKQLERLELDGAQPPATGTKLQVNGRGSRDHLIGIFAAPRQSGRPGVRADSVRDEKRSPAKAQSRKGKEKPRKHEVVRVLPRVP
jgi:folate-binding protein YgfZ